MMKASTADQTEQRREQLYDLEWLESKLAKAEGAVKGGRRTTVIVPTRLLRQLFFQRLQMAMLASPVPQFDNPLHIYAAQELRDRLLRRGRPAASLPPVATTARSGG